MRIRPVNRLTKKELQAEKNYWKKFYIRFSDYLQRVKGCYDNYTGAQFKCLRSFFNYLQKDKLVATGDFYKQFYIIKEDLPIITLMPEQLGFLIHDTAFHQSLTPALQRTKAIFIFGCTVALRFSDLFRIRYSDIELLNGQYYLSVRSLKTGTATRVKLPDYAVAIINGFGKKSGRQKTVFPPVSKNQFNKNVQRMAELAGWTQETGKNRTRRGEQVNINRNGTAKAYRFCDMITSHTMRRTAVTTMLMLGMPEHMVRKISGHAAGSQSFSRYVNFVQSWLDNEIDKVHAQLGKIN